VDKVDLLAQSPLFERMSTEELNYLCSLCKPVHLKGGETVFEEGSLGDTLFVIVRGHLEVIRKDLSGEEKVLTTLAAPQFFGEMSLIEKEFRSATVRAVSDTDLLQLSAENLNAFRRRYRDGFTFLVVNIARVLSARLRESSTRLAARL
jgi:CRP-like cAMP-binding protein